MLCCAMLCCAVLCCAISKCSKRYQLSRWDRDKRTNSSTNARVCVLLRSRGMKSLPRAGFKADEYADYILQVRRNTHLFCTILYQ